MRVLNELTAPGRTIIAAGRVRRRLRLAVQAATLGDHASPHRIPTRTASSGVNELLLCLILTLRAGTCQIPGCTKPVHKNSNGPPGKYCGLAHKE